jgi:electron transfer flavoprotein beta subunit
MKIVVCFKAVPEFDQVVEDDWNNFSLATDLSYVKRVFGCFDESALEMALRLRATGEEYGEKTECTALTTALLPAPLGKTLFAAGFDRVVDLSGAYPTELSAACREFQPRHTAAVLEHYLSSAGSDLILAGRQVGYADTGTVPFLLAEALGMPVVTGIEEIALCDGGIEIKRISDTARERLRVRLPLMAVIGNSPVSALRAVTLSARIAASKRSAEVPTLSLSYKAVAQAYRLSRERQHKTCRFCYAEDDLSRIVTELQEKYLQKGNR